MSFSGSSEPVEIQYPTVDDAIAVHALAYPCTEQESRNRLARPAKLEGALGRPQNYAAFGDADFSVQAAVLFEGIILDHGFEDGNKRLAVGLLSFFTELNGFLIDASDFELFVWSIAAERHMELNDLVELIAEALVLIDEDTDEPA